MDLNHLGKDVPSILENLRKNGLKLRLFEKVKMTENGNNYEIITSQFGAENGAEKKLSRPHPIKNLCGKVICEINIAEFEPEKLAA